MSVEVLLSSAGSDNHVRGKVSSGGVSWLLEISLSVWFWHVMFTSLVLFTGLDRVPCL